MPLSDQCSKCQLCFAASNPFIKTEFSELEFNSEKGVLFVSHRPSTDDDLSGKLFSPETKAGEFLRMYLSALEKGGIPWGIASLVQCGNTSTKPTEEQLKICTNQFFNPLLQRLKPKIVVALGLDAWEALVGEGVRSDLPRKTPEGLWVIPSYDPVVHAREQRDLRPHLIEMSEWINNIFSGKYCLKEFTYDRIHSKTAALNIVQTFGPEVIADVETEYCPTVPTKLNFYGRDSELLMIAACHRVEPGVYKTYVFEGEALCGEFVKSLLSRRTLINHNVAFDIDALKRFTGVDAYKCCTKIIDTLFEHWFRNQASVKNGLKELTQKHFMVPDYSADLKQEVLAVNEQIHAEERKRISEENRIRTKKRRELGIYANKGLNDDINFEEEDCHIIAINEIIYDYLEVPEDTRMELRPLWRQQDTLGYKGVNRDRLAYYAAQDAYFTARLWYEILEPAPASEKADPRVLKIAYKAMKTLSNISRVGLPLNMDKVTRLRSLCKDRTKSLYRNIISSPEVHKALYKHSPQARKVIEKYSNLKGTKKEMPPTALFQALCYCMNPNGKTLTSSLIAEYNPEAVAWLGRTEGGDLQINKDAMMTLGKVWMNDLSEEDKQYGYNFSEPRTPVEWIWHDIYFFKQNSKTLNSFLKKFVGYRGIDGAIHPSYHLTSTITGRTASKEPNGQNLKNDPAIMSCFECLDGYEFWGFDYVSLEPVVMSIVAGIESWKDVFRNQWDLYSLIANDVFKEELQSSGHWLERIQLNKQNLDKIKKERKDVRTEAKRGTLGKNYGQSARSFAAMYQLPIDQVERFYKAFSESYPELDKLFELVDNKVKNGGWIHTAFGRKRKFPYSRNRSAHASNVREGVNYLIQPFGNDVALIQAGRVADFLEKSYPEVLMCNFVHDAVYFIGPSHLREEVVPKIQSILQDNTIPEFEGIWDTTVPIRTSFKYSKTLAGLLE